MKNSTGFTLRIMRYRLTGDSYGEINRKENISFPYRVHSGALSNSLVQLRFFSLNLPNIKLSLQGHPVEKGTFLKLTPVLIFKLLVGTLSSPILKVNMFYA